VSALRRAALAGVVVAAAVATPLRAAESASEMHGMADAFAVPGVALAWGILRGASEAATVVVLRIVADPALYPAVAATGTDPFTQRTITVLAATRNTGRIDLRVPRAHFADYPRTDVRLYASASLGEADAPKAVVYYLGVPDTTPESASEAALDASLADRLARARAALPKQSP
jgi:hypothetical protein